MALSLYDALTRHQIYLERLKLGAGRTLFDPLNKRIAASIARELGSLGGPKMGQLTKSGMLKFSARIRQVTRKEVARFESDAMDWYKRLMNTEMTTTRELLEKFLDSNPSAARARLDVWAGIRNAIVPGTGETMTTMMSNLGDNMVMNATNLVRQAYANNTPVLDLQKQILQFMDKQGRNWTRATTDTIIQHVSTMAQNAIGQLYVQRYQYSAVLDDHTTQICEGLDGQIFVYGNGPVPPQHYKCRSKTVPLEDDDAEGYPHTDFASWLDTQPKSVKRDVERTGLAL